MKTYFRQRIYKSSVSFAVKTLILSLLLITMGLTKPASSRAQNNCADVNGLMTFDYRSWGIGIHRDCKCADGDIICYAGLPLCLAMKEKQILAGKPFEAWIIASRNSAANSGVSRIPDNIRRTLSVLYPASLLDKVYYTTDSGSFLTLQWFRDEMGKKGAITLIDIIVFADSNRAATDTKLWAHELEHIRQYDQLGVDGFAQAYFDQACILPGSLGYDSSSCQLERRADRKSEYWDDRGFVACCTRPATLELRDRVLNRTEEFIARDSITVGPNVVLQVGGNVTLEAGRVITLSPGFRTEPGGKLNATVVPSLNQTCTMP